MSRMRIDDLHKEWIKDLKYRREYEALEEEFSLAGALIEARTRARSNDTQPLPGALPSRINPLPSRDRKGAEFRAGK